MWPSVNCEMFSTIISVGYMFPDMMDCSGWLTQGLTVMHSACVRHADVSS